MRGKEIATVELFEAAKAAAVQINELGKAHRQKASENPTLVRLVAALNAFKPYSSSQDATP